MNIQISNRVLIISKMCNVCGKIRDVELNHVKMLVLKDKQINNVKK